MRRADGRAFVIDAAGSAEITDASSAFLRALATAGTAPPRPETETADGFSGAAGAADAPLSGLAPRAALPMPEPAAREPVGPRARSAANRREYFPRANRLYEALTGERRRREGDAASAAPAFSSPPPASAPLAVDAEGRRRALSPGALDRLLSLDDRHVGDATGLRRRRRRLEWSAPPTREERRAETEGATAPTAATAPRATEGTDDGPTTRVRRGGLDLGRVARELGASLRETRRGALDVEEEEDADGDVGRGGVLRARVAFLADALLAILREVDARSVAEGDDDGLGRLSGLLGARANGPVEPRDLAALAPTTVWNPVAPASSDAASAGALHRGSAPNAPNGKKALDVAPPAFYGAGGCDGDCADAPQCYICLDTFRGGEVIRTLPCGHAFHRACVDKWLLRSSRKCPTCRAAVPRAAPTPASNGNPARSPATAPDEPRGGAIARPLARPNLYFLPAPESFDRGAVPERVASPQTQTRA